MRGASWGTDERIVVGGRAGGLMQVPAAGGEATQLFKPENQGQASYPQVLPGGKAVLFTLSGPGGGELHLVKLDTGEHRTVLPAAVAGRVVPSGHLVFLRGGALWAVPFDLSRFEAIGTPVPVVEAVRVESGGAVQFDVSDEGSLVYIPGTASTRETALAFAGRDGSAELLTAPKRDYRNVALSPDGAHVAVQVADDDAADVWVVEIARGTLTRVTSEPGFDGNPMWSRDGKSIVFASTRDRRWTLHRRAADGTGEAELLATFDKARLVRPYTWTPDGGTLLIDVDGDIGSIAVNGKGEWQPLIQTAAFEIQPAVSPDGRWIAYGSSEKGRPEVYLQRFPALGDRRAVSVGGGYLPTWSRDGRELFYLRIGSTNAPMRVSVQTNKDGRADIGTPEVFTKLRNLLESGGYRPFDVSPDGQRLLVISRSGDAGTELQARQIHVVINWFEELKRLVPVK